MNVEKEMDRMCELFIRAPKRQQDMALAMLTEDEKNMFLVMVGCYKIKHDKEYRAKIMAATLKEYSRSI